MYHENKDNTAYLSNYGEYTTFSYNDRTITFYTGKRLDYYTDIVAWDNGYLVVMCKNKDDDIPEEDYIDLTPILENLLMDKNTFLSPIKEVRISHVGREETYAG